jgi:para-aminobenzoate synthetase component 1
MRRKLTFKIEDTALFKKQLFFYLSHCKHFAYLDSNNYKAFYPAGTDYIQYEMLAANGLHKLTEADSDAFSELKKQVETEKDWMFGVLAYELKEETHHIKSNKADKLEFPKLLFFIPKQVFWIKENQLTIEYLNEYFSETEVRETLEEIQIQEPPETEFSETKLKISQATRANEYMNAVKKLKEHIRLGDIYEVNYCTEFFAENARINPAELYQKLNALSPTPFSAFFRIRDRYLISASPERFMRKTGKRMIIQPIKGTIKRGETPDEDARLANKLQNDPKERAENVMITDLVRNDLSQTAKPATVKVEELFGIYKFPQVFQMISTVSSELSDSKDSIDAIKAAFPPGSMTGAPKKRAAVLAEQYETFCRSWYAGSMGYFTPEGDFDFNVIIRSILYNADNKYLSFAAGGALTFQSVAENEYEECLLKAKAIKEVLEKNTNDKA